MPWTISSKPCSRSVLVVRPCPKWIEAVQPGGVNCTARVCSSGLKSMSRRHPQALVEALGAVDVGDRQRRDLEPHPDGCACCGWVWAYLSAQSRA